jgi:peptide/nickel transport system substrate-binding protein
MKHRFFTLLILIVIAAMLLPACSPAKGMEGAGGSAGTGTQAANPPEQNSAQGGAGPQPDLFVASNVVLDPALAVDEEDRALIPYLYEGLVRAEGNDIIPALAVSWTVSVDELDYIFTLHTDAGFHDGTPLNADAVIVNFYRWFDPQDALHGSGSYEAWKKGFLGFKGEMSEGHPTSTFDGIQKIDDRTVLVHLNQPVDDFLFRLSDPAFAIVSPAALQAAGFGTSAGKDGGTGAYMLAEWSDAGLAFKPNPDYWDAAAIPSKDLFVAFSD